MSITKRIALFSVALFLSITPSAQAIVKANGSAAQRGQLQTLLTNAATVAVTVADNGNITIAANGNTFATKLRAMIADANVTVVLALVNGSTDVLIGAFVGKNEPQTLDLDDIAALDGTGDDGEPTQAGALIHEISEKYDAKKNNHEFGDAHKKALEEEDGVMGQTKRKTACGNSARRVENEKLVLYVPFKKGNTNGFARLLMKTKTEYNISSVTWVETVPNPREFPGEQLFADNLDCSYIMTDCLECVEDTPTPTRSTTWGSIKAGQQY